MSNGIVKVEDVIRYIADQYTKHKRLVPYWLSVGDVPRTDAVEVVRCRDCLMTKERDEYTNKVWCCRHREYMDYMYYCADGLRREDGDEE